MCEARLQIMLHSIIGRVALHPNVPRQQHKFRPRPRTTTPAHMARTSTTTVKLPTKESIAAANPTAATTLITTTAVDTASTAIATTPSRDSSITEGSNVTNKNPVVTTPPSPRGHHHRNVPYALDMQTRFPNTTYPLAAEFSPRGTLFVLLQQLPAFLINRQCQCTSFCALISSS